MYLRIRVFEICLVVCPLSLLHECFPHSSVEIVSCSFSLDIFNDVRYRVLFWKAEILAILFGDGLKTKCLRNTREIRL